MSEFVGRTGSLRVYSYPEPRRGGSADLFARNFATVKEVVIETGGTTATWVADVPADPVDVTQVPITPRSTGVVEVTGVLNIENEASAARIVSIAIFADGVQFPVEFSLTIEPGNTAQLVYLVQFSGLAIGVTIPITAVLTTEAGDGDMELDTGTMAVQEVPVPTG